MSIAGGTTTSITATLELIFVHLLIGSPRRTRRTSPSVMPQLARLPAGIRPTTFDNFFPCLCDFRYCPFGRRLCNQEPLLHEGLAGSVLGKEPSET
jgi:hypothetical protein